MTLNLFVNVYMNINFLLLSNRFKPIFSLPVEVRHGKRKMIQKRETSAGLWCIFCHACTCITLTTNNLLVMCNTTYSVQQQLWDQKFPAWSLNRASRFHIKWNRFWKPVSFDHKCGQQLYECVRGHQWSFSFLHIFSCCKRPLLAGNQIFLGGGISSYSHIGLISGPVFSFLKELRIQMVTLLHHKTEI